MIIDKSVGLWSKNSTELNDLAYQIYLLENDANLYNIRGFYQLIGQLRFVFEHETRNKYNNYFNEALIILRNNKITNINNINN